MSAPQNNIWLHRYAVLTALVTLGLIGMGGLVTSHEAGMAVPDWPTSYGYNMFALPFKFWKGGTFYEHTHRLWASGVGLLTTILVLWLFGKNSRPLMRWAGLTLLVMGLAGEFLFPNRWQDGVFSGATGLVSYGASFFWPRCERAPKWLRWLGVAAFLGVVAQGILGGLRVTLHMDNLGIFHAALAQLFLVLLCAIALFTSKWWMERRTPVRRETQAGVQALACSGGTLKREPQQAVPEAGAPMRWLFPATTILIFLQLILGATMRHQHAGLAIRDFPLAYGKLWPDMGADAVARYNAQRIEVTEANPITAFQIGLQMAHRIMAMVILCAVGACAWKVRGWSSTFRLSRSNTLKRKLQPNDKNAPRRGSVLQLWRLTLVWLGLILAQVGLGAWTIWSDKAADVATLHVLVGALSLVTGALLCIIIFCGHETKSGLATAFAAGSTAPKKI